MGDTQQKDQLEIIRGPYKYFDVVMVAYVLVQEGFLKRAELDDYYYTDTNFTLFSLHLDSRISPK